MMDDRKKRLSQEGDAHAIDLLHAWMDGVADALRATGHTVVGSEIEHGGLRARTATAHVDYV